MKLGPTLYPYLENEARGLVDCFDSSCMKTMYFIVFEFNIILYGELKTSKLLLRNNNGIFMFVLKLLINQSQGDALEWFSFW